MIAVVPGHDADAVGGGGGDGMVDCRRGGDEAEAVVAVEGGEDGCFLVDGEGGGWVDDFVGESG